MELDSYGITFFGDSLQFSLLSDRFVPDFRPL